MIKKVYGSLGRMLGVKYLGRGLLCVLKKWKMIGDAKWLSLCVSGSKL